MLQGRWGIKRSSRQNKKPKTSDVDTGKIISKRCQKIQAQFQYYAKKIFYLN